MRVSAPEHEPFRQRSVQGIIFLVLCAVLLAFAAKQASARSSPEEFASDCGSRVVDAANSGSSSGFAAALQDCTSIAAIARFSLGPFAADLPPDLESDLVAAVSRFVTRSFESNARRLQGGGFEVTGIVERPGYVEVAGRIVGSGAPVRWRLAEAGGGFRVIDVNVEGVWLSLQLRDIVTARLRQNNGDFEAVIASLETGRPMPQDAGAG